MDWFLLVNRRIFYKDFPEPSGGATIVCNKCRVTKNYFWKPRISFEQIFFRFDIFFEPVREKQH